MMPTDNIITLVAAVLAFIASVVATAVSLYNARFRRFATERWWERKADAYTRIIEALSRMVEYYRREYDSWSRGEELSEEGKKEIGKRWSRGYRETMEAANIGAFLISPEAEAALTKLQKGPERHVEPGDWFQELENDYVAAEECLRELVSCSRKDLRVS